jgi:hypothetical protein
MHPHADRNDRETRAGNCEGGTRTRAAYQTPRLVIYGDFAEVTKAKGGTSGDGAMPKTRM